jgi:hypothetical protein
MLDGAALRVTVGTAGGGGGLLGIVSVYAGTVYRKL